MRRRNVAAAFVVALGGAQMVGYLTGAKTVSACGAGSCLSPMAEVFSAISTADERGNFEPFASAFTLRGVDGEGAAFERVLTPELLARVNGPQARRAAYGNAFALAPRLPETVWQSAWCQGFGENGPLRAAFELPAGAHELAMTVKTLTDGRDDQWVLSPSCTR